MYLEFRNTETGSIKIVQLQGRARFFRTEIHDEGAENSLGYPLAWLYRASWLVAPMYAHEETQKFDEVSIHEGVAP